MSIDFFLLIGLSTFILGAILIPLLPSPGKSILGLIIVAINSIITSILAIKALTALPIESTYFAGLFLGNITFRIDSLSAWFIIIINFTTLMGCIYGIGYLKPYAGQRSNLSLHWISYILFHLSMLLVCIIQNGLAFLIVWELMSISSFLLVIFEHSKWETLKAGLNYLLQMHISLIFLMIAVIWIFNLTNSYGFASIQKITTTLTPQISLIIFFFFFIGFAIKAGFVPFHTWLPYAHPAAPTHISGVMSGVIIKMGIYGILRMLLLFHLDFLTVGWIILAVSVISGLYGVMLAIIQHNIKKLLAYHSIENIGIIGIGIGIGCIGLGTHNDFLAITGFTGALLHTLNHSLFKSLLFFGAGNVYQAIHTFNIESMGGLIKRMPSSALLFLLAALAICGLPPFNGFISEFVIYSGLYNGLMAGGITSSVLIMLSVLGLALIGGFALLCFTKAFGIIFLGTERQSYHPEPVEAHWVKLLPMYLIGIVIISIGIFPQIFLQLLEQPVSLFVTSFKGFSFTTNFTYINTLQSVSLAVICFIALCALVYFIRNRVTSTKPQSVSPTWGCGYVGSDPRLQYTANSFIRIYRKLVEPILSITKKSTHIKEVFPQEITQYESHPYDKIESGFIDFPLLYINRFFNIFRFLQNGQTQYYILYGVVFIIVLIVLSLFI